MAEAEAACCCCICCLAALSRYLRRMREILRSCRVRRLREAEYACGLRNGPRLRPADDEDAPGAATEDEPAFEGPDVEIVSEIRRKCS